MYVYGRWQVLRCREDADSFHRLQAGLATEVACIFQSPTFCLRPNGCKWRGVLDENVWKMICNQVGCKKASGLDTTASVAALPMRPHPDAMRCLRVLGCIRRAFGCINVWLRCTCRSGACSASLCTAATAVHCAPRTQYTRSIMAFELGHDRPASKHRVTPPQGPAVRSSPLRSLRRRLE
jgi:hypothetical protein